MIYLDFLENLHVFFDKNNHDKFLIFQKLKPRLFTNCLEFVILVIVSTLEKLHLIKFFFYQGFFTQTLVIHRTAGEVRGQSFIQLCHFHLLTNIPTFICNFACEYLSRIFNRIACIYQTATRWDLPPYWITIWLIDYAMLIFCLFTWWFDSRFLLQQFDTKNRLIWTRINFHPWITSELTRCASHPNILEKKWIR